MGQKGVVLLLDSRKGVFVSEEGWERDGETRCVMM